MKKIIIVTFLLLISTLIHSQNYRGVVMDTQNEPIAFANVIALGNGDLIAGTITDEEGKFEITINKNQSFTLVISFLGFEDWKKEIYTSNAVDLGFITLEESQIQLDEVIITAKKPIIKRRVDRLVFSVAKQYCRF